MTNFYNILYHEIKIIENLLDWLRLAGVANGLILYVWNGQFL